MKGEKSTVVGSTLHSGFRRISEKRCTGVSLGLAVICNYTLFLVIADHDNRIRLCTPPPSRRIPLTHALPRPTK
jgi:hypothetical protein